MRERYEGHSFSATYYRGGFETVWKSDFRVASLDRIKPNVLDAFFVPKASREAYDIKLRLSFDMNKNFRQFLNVNRSAGLDYDLRDDHHGMAQAIAGGVASNFNDLVEANPRPNRQDRRGMGMRRALARAADTEIASRYDARGFEVDYNRLERVVVDDQGRPYMRAVIHGYLFATEGMFSSQGGKWRVPAPQFAGTDPRFFTVKSRGAPPVVLSFPGYGTDFIDDVFKQARNELPATAFWIYVNNMVRNFPNESKEYIVNAATHIGRGAGVKGGFGQPLKWTPSALKVGGQFTGFRRFSR